MHVDTRHFETSRPTRATSLLLRDRIYAAEARQRRQRESRAAALARRAAAVLERA